MNTRREQRRMDRLQAKGLLTAEGRRSVELAQGRLAKINQDDEAAREQLRRRRS